MRCVVLAAAVLSVVAMRVYADICASHANGCSIPFGWTFFYKNLFTPSCNRHDICYGCGALHGLDKASCDSAFLVDMKVACATARRKRMLPEKRSAACATTATSIYYAAVRFFGSPHYHAAGTTEHFCTQSWVSSCLP